MDSQDKQVPLQTYGTNGQPQTIFVPVAMPQPPNTAYPHLITMNQNGIPLYHQGPSPVIINNADGVHLLENQTPAPSNGCHNSCETKEGCKWREGNCRWSKCCRLVSKQPLGETWEFVLSLLLSTMFPVVSAMMVFAMESTQMARIGTLYGNGNFFLLLAIHLIRVGVSHHALYAVVVLGFLAALILYIVGCKYWCSFLVAYKEYCEKHPEEKATATSDAGCRKDYWISFFISLIFPVIGTIIRMLFNKTLSGRFGGIKGIAWHFLITGAITAWMDQGGRIIIGILLLQFASTHFRKVLVAATGEIFSCRGRR